MRIINRKISILIPAYNAEKYILKNLESLNKQTYKNLEIIVVNDGSTDRTQVIVEEYFKKYKLNARLINIENGGLANARNVAIANATGDFMCNLDADDYLDYDIFQKVNEIQEDFDICYYGWKDVMEETYEIKGRYDENFEFIDGTIDGIEAAIGKLSRKLWICQGNAIYRLDMIKKNKILNLKGYNQGEDLYFITRALIKAKKVCCVKLNAFNCLNRKASMMHSDFNESHLEVLELINRFKEEILEYNIIEKERDVLIDLLTEEYYRNLLGISRKIIDSSSMNRGKKTIQKYILDKINKEEIRKIKLNRIMKFELKLIGKNVIMYGCLVKSYRKLKRFII